MPTSVDVVRSRRRRRSRDRAERWLGRVGTLLAGLLAFLVGGGGLLGALIYTDLSRDLPSVEEIESLFDPSRGGVYRSTRLYDRTGQVLLFDVANPRSASREALSVDPAKPGHIPESLIQATVAFQDPTFWSNRGYDPNWLVQAILAGLRGRPIPIANSITQQLVRNTLVPPDEHGRSPLARALREVLLASELTGAYSKDQILEWYLNSAYYGQLAYGADAAALVYFGKHATDLSPGESALLAGMPLQPSLNPINAPQQAKARQALVLEAVIQEGMVSRSIAEAALAEPLDVQAPQDYPVGGGTDFSFYVLRRLEEMFGSDFAHRGGLRVTTTLDYDLQLQAECVAMTQVARLQGGDPATVVPAAAGSACVAASLLSPLRPSDAGVDHNVSSADAVVIDPRTGEILSIVGSAAPNGGEDLGGLQLPDQPTRQPGSAFFPFIYLTAFASGYTPASMVLDVPTVFSAPGSISSVDVENDDHTFHGPVRMRTALANSYNVSAVRLMSLMGVDDVLRTARQMGITTLEEAEGQSAADLAFGGNGVTLLDLVYAYSVMANGGFMAGEPIPEDAQRTGFRDLDAVAILRIESASGWTIYEVEGENRAVVSPQLAYLMADVLSDDSARWLAYGHPNPLEIGRPAGAKIGTTRDDVENWTVGFTPSRAVGVWVGNLGNESMQRVGALNGAAPIWNALIRYATRDVPPEGWERPPGVSEVEVCDPSGLLPTEYCPNVVREEFVQGTEPTHYDTLYQPFRVNRETGKLATLFTPPSLVEENVYLIPPPEAAAWARQVGIEQPPQEYDTIYEQPFDPEVNIGTPVAFDTLHGNVLIRGDARPEGFEYYRLQYGQGLNPVRWVQLGEDVNRPVMTGLLGTWDTIGLSGLYTLQLLVVRDEGRVATAAVPVTIDNEPPTLRLILPEDGQVYTWPADREAILQVEVGDDVSLSRVEFFVDSRKVATAAGPPFSTRWPLGGDGEHIVFARAYDAAGNRAESERVTIRVVR